LTFINVSVEQLLFEHFGLKLASAQQDMYSILF
jgi:hypothetical protein